MFTIESSIYSLFFKIDFSINTVSQTSLNDSIYTIITNIIQTIERKDNKVIEKVGDLRDDLNIEEQLKDLRGNLGITKGNIRLIPNPDFNIDRLEKLLITSKPFNLEMKILKNAFYIVMKNSIYIYSKDLQKARIF